MEKPLFDIQQITHQYPDGTLALNNLSLAIPKGKKIAVLGHNGAGKSTLFQHLNGLIHPQSGTILFNGELLSYTNKALKTLRQQVGIVFQDSDTQLFSGTVKKDVAFGPLNLGWSKDKIERQIDWAMQITEVTPLQNRPIHFLSGGQKKRAAIAGVLAMNPSVLILDEPTAGLDNYFANQLMQLLNNLMTDNRTILLSTHDTQLAYEWAEYFIVLHEGQAIYSGDAYQLFENKSLLKHAHLECPWTFDLALALKKRGILSSTKAFPRTKQQFIQLIESQAMID